jgi:hypothetical protein
LLNVFLHKYRRRLLMTCPRTGALHFFSPPPFPTPAQYFTRF